MSDIGILSDAADMEATEAALGQLLVEREHLNAAGLDRGTRVAATSGEPLHVVLTKLGLVTERDMASALADQLGLPQAGRKDYPDEPLFAGSVSEKFLKESRVVPLGEAGDELTLAMADPLDSYAVDAIQLITGKTIHPWVGIPAEIEAAIERLYGSGKSSFGEIIEDITEGGDEGAEEDVERLRDLASEAPVIRLVNMLISRAVESRASDIHIEPFEDRLRVRYRIDGVLQDADAPPGRLRAALISRVKLMAKLNIAERRLPQDGRIKIAVRGKEIDLRVSTVPTMHGESVVLRILDKGSVTLDFESLGFSEPILKPYLASLDRPDGIMLVTGPTGSGKTTTLYTSLMRLNTPEKKLVTVEDPCEYQLDGVNQIQVKQQIGLSFANVLRSILRQDPDVIMIGEIRDLETAEIAVQAALTGHMVLSTLHTNNAAGSVTRLLDMGVEDYMVTSTVNAIAAQRLVRTLCPHCREAHQPVPELVDQLGLARFGYDGASPLYRPKGCDECSDTGFFGRTTILEVMPITEAVGRLILKHAESGEIQRAAVAEGMQTMFEDGVRKALAGTTTIEEVLRVTRDV